MNLAVRSARLTRFDVLALALIALVGLANVPMPFTWDQSLFAMGAKALNHGAVLYRDYWDTKQPGIFLFDLAAGRLFGFDEIGVHLFELLWQLGFAAALMIGLRRYFEHGVFASLAPVFAVGLYYAVVNDASLTQVEALVGLPLFLALWAVLPGEDGEPAAPWRFLFSGLMGAVVLIFKLMFAPMVGVFWIIAFVDAIARRRTTFPQALLRMALPVALGLALPLGGVWAYFRAHGVWDLVWWTWSKFPLQVMAQAKIFRLGELIEGLSWFVFRFSALLAVGFVGAMTSFDPRRRVIGAALVAWFVLGSGIILAQRESWWPYQYLLLLPPTAILAARGLDFLWGRMALAGTLRPNRMRAYGVVTVLLLTLAAIGAQGVKAVALVRSHFALTPASRDRFQSLVASQMPYALVRDEVAFLSRPGSAPGSLYVIGNPLFSYFSGRENAGSRNAAIMAQYVTAEEWVAITHQLAERRPAYIFIEKQMLPILESRADRASSFFRLLGSSYVLLRHSDRGYWFIRADAAAPKG